MSTTLLKSLTTKAEIAEIIKTDYEGASIEELEALAHEITDGIVPVYYSDIIGEWQAMSAEFDGEGVARYGLPEEKEINVYKLMSLDLYAYYYDLTREAIEELEEATND